jgi:hypothetical protein
MQELTRNKRGVESDKLLLETIKNYPGLSQYELIKKLDWQSGRVDGAIRRLVNKNLIVIKSIERNGRQVNLAYPKDRQSSSLVTVPANLLQTENQAWLDWAYVYALDSATIGIAGQEMPEWKEASCFSEKIPVKKDKENLILQIPDKMNRFYNIERKHKVTTINGNAVLITISGNIIEEKKYPS